MSDSDRELNIAEIPFETGELKFRYSRYLSSDGKQWIRHGLFQAFHPNGRLSSEGYYDHGLEAGLWRDYYENGCLAAEGHYELGVKHGVWRFWNDKGEPEQEEVYDHGTHVG